MYKGNDWRPVVDKGIPAFTQKPSLGVGAGVYPPSFGVIQATRAARCARLLPTVFGSSAENAFACSLSTSIRADHRAVLGMHDGHDPFPKACCQRRSNRRAPRVQWRLPCHELRYGRPRWIPFRFPHRTRRSIDGFPRPRAAWASFLARSVRSPFPATIDRICFNAS